MSELNKLNCITVYLGLGSNLGNREKNLVEAINYLKSVVKINKISSPYETEPIGFKDQADFLNAVISGNTDLNPPQLLSFVKKAENELGRTPSFINGPRKIDIDILFYGDQTIDSGDLVIPHRRIAERSFVIVPMVEIDAEFIHPVLHTKIRNLLAKVNNHSKIIKRKWKNKNTTIINSLME